MITRFQRIFIVLSVFILLSSLPSFCLDISAGNARYTIYKNRLYFIEVIQIFDKNNASVAFKDDFLKILQNDSIDVFQREPITIFRAVFDIIKKASRVLENKYYCTNDSLTELLFSFLNDTTSQGEWIGQDAVNLVKDIFPYSFLEKKSTALRAALMKKNHLKEMDKLDLLFMAHLTAKETNNLLNSKNQLPLHLRARLGDENALDSLFHKYDAVKFDTSESYKKGRETYKEKRELAQQLIFTGEKGIKHCISKFNDEMYDDRSWYKRTGGVHDSTRQCYEESIRWPIITGILKWHPDDTLLLRIVDISQKQYDLIFEGIWNFKKTKAEWEPDKQQKFDSLNILLQKKLDEFDAWSKQKYGISPEGKPSKYILLRKYCGGPDIINMGDYNLGPQKNIDEEIKKLRQQTEEAQKQNQMGK
jgi:hypothetical protein